MSGASSAAMGTGLPCASNATRGDGAIEMDWLTSESESQCTGECGAWLGEPPAAAAISSAASRSRGLTPPLNALTGARSGVRLALNVTLVAPASAASSPNRVTEPAEADLKADFDCVCWLVSNTDDAMNIWKLKNK